MPSFMRDRLSLVALVIGFAAIILVLWQYLSQAPAAALYIHKIAPLGSASSLTLDASKRTILVTESGGVIRFCSEPVPDAVGTLATEIAANVSSKKGSLVVGAEANGMTSVEILKLFERSQGIQALRDGMYRLCEAYLNEAISQNVYRNHMIDLVTTLNFIMPLEICTKLMRDLDAGNLSEAGWNFMSDCARWSVDVTTLVAQSSAERLKEDADVIKAEAVLQATRALERRPAAAEVSSDMQTAPRQ